MPRIIKALVVSTLLWSTSAMASTYIIKGVEAGDTLNMRQQPGTYQKVLARLPADAQGIQVTGKTTKIGSTTWAEIRYQNQLGWVSKRFLTPSTGKSTASLPSKNKHLLAEQVDTPSKSTKPVTIAPKAKPVGSWILECGSASPYWKAEVLPKSINLYQGDYSTNVPLTFKNQLHGGNNQRATSTVVVGDRGKDRVSLTIRYSGQCSSSLAKRRVSFRVSGKLNGEKVSGCCYSYPAR
jgi:uncharacterized membrane protein